MKTLFVTHHYLNGFGGGVFASRGIIRAFALLSDGMTLLCPAAEGHTPEGIPGNIRVCPILYEKSKAGKFWDLLRGRLHRFEASFRKEIALRTYDVVVFDCCYPSFGLIAVARQAGCRVITVHHNFQCEYVRDNYRFPLRGPMLFWTRRCERDAVRGSDLNLTLTEADKVLLHTHYDAVAPVSVLGVFEPEERPAVIPHAVSEDVFLITGDLGIAQTRDSLLTWLRDYYPVLREVFSSPKLILAGKNPAPTIRAFCRKNGIELEDTPVDMEPVLRRGKYYICPVSKGGGIKLRIMDGLSHGLNVITHAVSARGYEVFEGTSLFSYDGILSFRTALERLKAMHSDAEDTIRIYREVFSFPSGVARLRRILEERNIL